MKFNISESECTSYINSNGTNVLLILFLYVDDLIYTSSSILLVEFEMTNLVFDALFSWHRSDANK
jgi:hypothetical protein